MTRIKMLLLTLVVLCTGTQAYADEESAWWSLESAAYGADMAASSLSATGTGAIGSTFDLSLQYLDGLISGGKPRDATIESMVQGAFGTVGNAIQSDANAFNSFQAAFGNLQIAAGALQTGSFQTAEDAANSGSMELFNTEAIISQYGMDLMQLEYENSDLSTAIQDWLSGSGGMGCP